MSTTTMMTMLIPLELHIVRVGTYSIADNFFSTKYLTTMFDIEN